MAKKSKDNIYFASFASAAAKAEKATKFLLETLQSYTVATSAEARRELHEIEHSADVEKHEMKKKLLHEFITPIDREDISEIAEMIDDCIDMTEDILIRIYMYNVSVIKPEAIEMAKILNDCAAALCLAFKEFPDFAKSDSVQKALIEINRLEEVGDDLYFNAMHTLYSTSTNQAELAVWSRIFDCLEDCCDSYEHAADIIESVIMKNS